MIGANNFFELSHPARQKILELVMESPKRHSDLAKALKIAPAEVTRHLRRLVQSDYIIKNDESRFVITQYGRIASRHLEIMDFIADNVDLFNQLDLSAIPVELMSYSILKDAGILKGPMKIFEKILQVTEMADGIVHTILTEPIDPLIMLHGHQLKRGLELRLIFEHGKRIPAEYSDQRLMSLEMRDCPAVIINMIITEKEAVVIFPDTGGGFGFSHAFTGTDEDFLRWCWLIYEYYWMLGNDIIL